MSGMPKHQRGIAVITAMLVVTIATVLAVELAWKTNLDLRRTEGVMAWDQTRQLGYAAEPFVANIIKDSFEEHQTMFTRADDAKGCLELISVPMDLAEGQSGGLNGNMCDLQGRFNLNNLINGPERRRDDVTAGQFRRLIEAVARFYPDVDFTGESAPDRIVDSTIDWIDPDTDTQPGGAEDDAYTGFPVPYRTANVPFIDVSEFSAVRGVTPAVFAALAPFITALPARTAINVNTAYLPVLMSLGDDIDVVNAEQWCVDGREGIADPSQFAQYLANGVGAYVGFGTSYFELKGTIGVGTTRLGMYSLLESSGTEFITRLRQFDVVEVAESEPEPASDDAANDETDDDEVEGKVRVVNSTDDPTNFDDCMPRNPG